MKERVRDRLLLPTTRGDSSSSSGGVCGSIGSVRCFLHTLLPFSALLCSIAPCDTTHYTTPQASFDISPTLAVLRHFSGDSIETHRRSIVVLLVFLLQIAGIITFQPPAKLLPIVQTKRASTTLSMVHFLMVEKQDEWMFSSQAAWLRASIATATLCLHRCCVL